MSELGLLPTAGNTPKDLLKVIQAQVEAGDVQFIAVITQCTVEGKEAIGFSASRGRADKTWWILTKAMDWFKFNHGPGARHG